MTETKKETTQDPADLTRDLIERGAATAKAYTAAMSTATIAGMRSAFDLQNGFIVAGRAVVDAAVVANTKLADQAAQAIKSSQAETTKLVEAGAKLVSESLEIKL
jgi:hypothetical protein